MYDFDTSATSNYQSDRKPNTEKPVFKINDVLLAPKDQDLRHMRHHVRWQDHNGVIGYMPQVIQEVTPHSPKIGLQSHQSLNTVNTEPEILGSRENTTLMCIFSTQYNMYCVLKKYSFD